MHEPGLDEKDKNNNDGVPSIPIEIVGEEEMALIEAAFAATPYSLSSTSSEFPRTVRSIHSITLRSKRSFSGCSAGHDIEDMGNFRNTQKRKKVPESFLHRFRRKRGISVTDITATEWCEKQMEFVLLLSKRKTTEAMRVGSARHAILEEEVVEKVSVHVESVEDTWALKFLNFIAGANQLLFEGLTRELPLIGFVEGVWMVGVVDEIQMPKTEMDRNPILLDTKTRGQNTIPSEPQQRSGRLQLMCYKYLWDNIVGGEQFPSEQFFSFFSLNPHRVLSREIRKSTANSGLPAKTLDDVVRYFRSTCSLLPPANHQLVLRYELQKDNSLLAEHQFAYDSGWLKGQIQSCLEFWRGEREASYTPQEERWKCRFCQFASKCPTNSTYDGAPSSGRINYATLQSSSNTDSESTKDK